MTEMDDWVGFYEANHLVYFPIYGVTNGLCRCAAGVKCGENTGKHPIYKWKDLPSRAPKPLDNVGISTNNLVVIDLDGDVSEEALDAYPRTFTTSTGHGFHIWYAADPSKPVKSCVGWKHKVDVRAMGGLIIAPPSRHRSGTNYRHVRGDSIQPVPRWLLDALPERGHARAKIGAPPLSEIPDTTQPMWACLGAGLVSAMENWEEGRNQTLFRLGCRYFELAASKLVGTDVLSDLMEAALRTGLTSAEIERTLESARKSV